MQSTLVQLTHCQERLRDPARPTFRPSIPSTENLPAPKTASSSDPTPSATTSSYPPSVTKTPLVDVHDEQCAQHVQGQQQTRDGGERANEQCCAADELDEGGVVGRQFRGGNAHLAEAGTYSLHAGLVEFLPAVGDEHDAQADASNQQCERSHADTLPKQGSSGPEVCAPHSALNREPCADAYYVLIDRRSECVILKT